MASRNTELVGVGIYSKGFVVNACAPSLRSVNLAISELVLIFNKALAISRKLTNPEQVASLLNSIGFLYMEQEDYAQARAKFDESLKIYRSAKNQREESRVLLNLGVIEQRQGNYDEALVYFKLSLQAAKATQNADVQIAAGEGIGVALAGRRDFAAALQALNESLELAKEMKDRTRQTELLWRSAQVHNEVGDYARSSELAQTALNLARDLRLPKLIYLATTTLGESFAAQNKIELAIQTLKDSIEQAEAMRNQVAGQEVARQLVFENKVSGYIALIELLIKHGKLQDALLYAERAKGRVLLDVLSSGRADIAKYLAPAEKAETQRLNRRISELNDRINLEESADSSSLDSLYRQLDAARLEYQSFQDALYVAHPELRLRTGRTAALTSADINQLTLDKDSAYLEYVLSKQQLYVFVLTRKGATGAPELKVYPLASNPDDLALRVNQFHQRLATRHPDVAGPARELYTTLIQPVVEQLRGVRTICIVPDGFLWNLPFQALMPRSNHYLIEDYGLYYAHSLGVLREMTKEKTNSQRKKASLLAIGNPAIGRDGQRKRRVVSVAGGADRSNFDLKDSRLGEHEDIHRTRSL